MRFFSKIVVICNLCFIASIVLRYVEIAGKHPQSDEKIIPLPWIENTVVILGYSAILFNIVFFLCCLILLFMQKISIVPVWMIVFNVVILSLQFVYFFTNFIA